MRNPFFASRPDMVAHPSDLNTATLLTETGQNFGNLLFFSASRRVIKHTLPSSGLGFDPAYVRANHDGIIIPAANWLTAARDLGNLGALIEKANLPTIVLGLGAQSFTGKIPELHPNTKRFLHAVGDRSKDLSVRGQFTAEVVEAAGVKNVAVTGCPSLLWHVTRPAQAEKKLPKAAHISVNSTRFDQRTTIDGRNVPSIGMRLARIAFRDKLDFVIQTEDKLLEIARSELKLPENVNDIIQIQKILGAPTIVDVVQYLRDRARYFTDVPSWIDYMRTCHFGVGMRLHGVIASLLAGTPAMLITHDTRTVEMAKHAGIPNISSEDLAGKTIDFDKIYQSIDLETFNRRQIDYYKAFKAFFESNGVETNLISI